MIQIQDGFLNGKVLCFHGRIITYSMGGMIRTTHLDNVRGFRVKINRKVKK